MLQKWLYSPSTPSTLLASGKLGLITHSAESGIVVASWVSRFEITAHSAQVTKKERCYLREQSRLLAGWDFFVSFFC